MAQEKIVNISITQNVFDKVSILAKKNKRSVRAEIAIIVETKVNRK